MKILVTGGCGYIGSHVILELINKNYELVVLDNLSNSSVESMNRIEKLSGVRVEFIKTDILDKENLRKIFKSYEFYAVMHFAGLKAVSESLNNPHLYYQNNVFGSLCLLEVMNEFNVNNFIFSSSATIYGEQAKIPYLESMQQGNPTSPYGYSKVMVERILYDSFMSNSEFRAISLRYFNPIGAHPSGEIGEDPLGIPNNLLPYIADVAVGNQNILNIYGDNYPTKDGTCRRDYLHVVDLAKGHVQALEWLQENNVSFGFEAFNLGTGEPVSVLEIVNSFINETGVKINFRFVERREGDLPEFWADVTKARKILGWNPTLFLSDMVKDTWNWKLKNPRGYQD